MRTLVLAAASVLLVSGCLVPPDRIQQIGHSFETTPNPGLRYTVDYVYEERRNVPNRLTVDALAENFGTYTWHIRNICLPPWRIEISGPRGLLAHEEPRAHCEAIGYAPFGPGQNATFQFTWDAHQWNDAAQRLEPVPAAEYTVTVFFEYLEDKPDQGYCCKRTLQDSFAFEVRRV